jgi:hypothetical protein
MKRYARADSPIRKDERLELLRNYSIFTLRRSFSCPELQLKEKKLKADVAYFLSEHRELRRNLDENSRGFIFEK